jgi:hypothetical protein
MVAGMVVTAAAIALAIVGLIGCAGLGYLVVMQKTIIEELRGDGPEPEEALPEIPRAPDAEFFGFKR